MRVFKTKNGGFTLLEVMVVVAIALTLTVIAVPSFQATMTRNRIAGQVSDFFTALQFTRTEAIKQGSSVSMCASRDQLKCNTTNANAWQDGYIVFTDINNNGAIDSGDVILKVWLASTGTETAVASNSLSAFTFNRQGFAAGLPSNPVTVAISAAAKKDTSNNRCIMISLTGRIQTKAPTDGVCS